MLRLLKYSMRYRWRLLGGGVSITLASAAFLAVPALIGTAIDDTLSPDVRGDLMSVAAVIVLLHAAIFVLHAFNWYFFQSAALHLVHDLRVQFFERLQDLSFGFHDRQKTGDLMSRATSDMNGIRWFIGGTINFAYEGLLFFLGVAVVLLAINWRLGLVSMAFMPIIVWRTSVMVPRMHDTWQRSQEETARMANVVQENLTGMRVVKAFAAAPFEREKFRRTAAEVERLWFAASMLAHSRQLVIDIVYAAATGATLWVGANEVTSGRLTAGELVAFVLYLRMLAWPLDMVGMVVSGASRAASATRRIFEIIDSESPVVERPSARPLDGVRGSVRFENVSAGYDDGVPAVRNLDFEIEPGQMVAVLGAPGSGKSTLVHLIPRFYDVTSGRITIDGVDIRDITLGSLRRNVGIVMQDVFAFSASLKDNIAYGVDGPEMDAVAQAAKVAQIHEFIESLPDGYDAKVGERGLTLSGGQRQRLAIARTVLLDPPLLILDDSTSSVDVKTEYEIQRAMAEVVKSRTTFVIAHRLSTVRNADLILVLENGEIIERGTHDELLAADGYYRRIHDLQLRPEEEASRFSEAVEGQELHT